MKQIKRHQSGFTLVEIAIVLVIIGLLLGGVLKGQAMIDSAKVKSLAADFKAIPTMVYGYQDQFRSLPGDDSAAVAHLGAGSAAASTPAATLGNGAINGFWNSITATDESVMFWQHVRMAGLGSGSATVGVVGASNTSSGTSNYLPSNAVGSRVGLSNTMPIAGMLASTLYVCSTGIDGKLALQLDTMMDDGVGTTGSMRISAITAIGTAGAAVAPVAGTSYMVCMSV
jgi:prepilin-type N-terminal cleavage/methylation domain-containing protein